jgi:hypothetical protein
LVNFGKNVRFQPSQVVTPRSEDEILSCLNESRSSGRNVKAVGSLHSWSDIAATDGVTLDLRHLNRLVLASQPDGALYADIEAGCTIDRALDYLQSHGGYTLPTYGMFGGQTIAGAISTATHGSGRSSLSHYVSAVRVAAYDGHTGRARIYEWAGGDPLRAARCALGCMGVLLMVRFLVEPGYLIEERTEWYARLDEVLAHESEYPRQQFYLIPWSWRWFAQHRRQVALTGRAAPSPGAPAQRVLRRVGVDVLLNGVVRMLSRTLESPDAIRSLYRRGFPMIARSGTVVVDRPRDILMMRHDFYTHVEMELFVPARSIVPAAEWVEWVLRSCGGDSLPRPASFPSELGAGTLGELEALRGKYVHDHAITVRRVLPDDALISMTSGADEDGWYAMSLVTYQRDTSTFVRMAGLMARTMASAFAARPHWGKVFPLDGPRIDALYPEIGRFRACCRNVDPEGRFVNAFARRALSL